MSDIKFEDRRFGVELECIPSGDGSPNGICQLLERETGHRWSWDYDGGGHEFKTPPLRQDEFDVLRAGVNMLRDSGYYAATSAGLHVHLEAGDLTTTELKRFVKSWAANQEHINMLVDQGRVGNRYCSEWTAGELNMLDRLVDGVPIGSATIENDGEYDPTTGRYNNWYGFDSTFNRFMTCALPSLDYHGTIEIRQHHSSVDPDEVEAWVKFLLSFYKDILERGVSMPKYKDIQGLFRRTKPEMRAELRKKLDKRRNGLRLINTERATRSVMPPMWDDDDYSSDYGDDYADDYGDDW